jgi:hypothetical protein
MIRLAYNEIILHLMPHTTCQEHDANMRHCHCYRCGLVLTTGDRVAKFRGRGKVTGRHGIPKYFCLDCGKLLSDSTVRNSHVVAC